MLKAILYNTEELSKYYCRKRKKIFNKKHGIPQNLKLHNILHRILIYLIKLLRIIQGYKIILLEDNRKPTTKPIIYACTHIGGTDIQTAFEVIKSPCWLFLGDPREIYKNLDGILLRLNGVICVELNDKDDRKIAKETSIQLLRHKGNLLIFPEGAWNISENLPVMKLFPGTAEIAIKSNADIVPIALECNGKNFYAAIGENISTSNFDVKDKYVLTALLRDKMATLKWKCWEQVGMEKRRNISSTYSEQFLKNILLPDGKYSYKEKDIFDTMFNDKTISSPNEVFQHLKEIVPNTSNAFLFNKRNHN